MTDPTADRVEPEHTDVTGSGRSEESSASYERSPRDVLRLVVFGVVALVMVLVTRYARNSISGFERDIINLLDFLPRSVQRILNGAMQIFVAVIVLTILGIAAFRRNWRLFGYLVLGGVVASLLMSLIETFVERTESNALQAIIDQRGGVNSQAFPSAITIAYLTSSFVILGVFMPRRWRKAGAIVLTGLVVVRLLISAVFPINVFIALPVGAAIGAGILFALGRPDRRPTLDGVRAALVDSGLRVAVVRKAKVDARGSTPYFATLEDGQGVFVKVLGEEERSADLLFRVYRFLRLKNVGDARPFSSLRRTVEHEALVSLYARDVGVLTPRMRGVVDVGSGSMLLAQDMIDGKSLDALADDEVTDDVMRDTWRQIALLRKHRIAHRDLRRANVFIGANGNPWMIDFGFSELAASDTLLSADVAQMLASFAVVASPERTVACAVEVLGPEAVATALPRLQMPALSGATQTALKHKKGRLEALQKAVVDQCNVAHVEYEPLVRVKGKTIFMVIVLAIATWVLIPQFADLQGIVDQVKDANWRWFPLVLLMSMVTYVGATFSLSGAIPNHLPAFPTFATQVGSSFCSKLAPAGLGGMALNIRYLQKQGVDEPVAVSGVGLNSAAGLVGHVTLILIFLLWAGKDAFGGFSLPDPKWILVGIGVVVLLAALGMVITASRKLILGKLVPILRRAVHGMADVFKRPGKLAVLLFGSLTVTLSYLLGVYFSTQAFGGGLPLATVGAVYLAGAAIATAAPTPGGLGAMEAALIAGLVAAGMHNATAVPAVFMFRLATFWLPILPGWISFMWLERKEYI
jgi:undecaprenyl-diphosphatase